jgi:hypothetical protein
MKKIVFVALIFIAFNSCSKDDYTQPEPIEENQTNFEIEEIGDIKKDNLVITNGNTTVSATTTNEIPTNLDESSVSTLDGDLVYVYNSTLDPETKLKTSAKGNFSAKTLSNTLKFNAKETARSIVFFKAGFSLINPSDDYVNKIGTLIEYGAQSEQFKKYVEIVTSDIRTYGELTEATLNNPVVESITTYLSTLMKVESLIVDWPGTIEKAIEGEFTENNLDNIPKFLVQKETSAGIKYFEKVTKLGAANAGAVVDIKKAEEQSDGSWNLDINFYNKTPAYKYLTSVGKTNGVKNDYDKNTFQNIIDPYDSNDFYKNFSSFSGIFDRLKDIVDISKNGFSAVNLQTTDSKKSEVEINISTNKNYILLGSLQENKHLKYYAIVELLSQQISATSSFIKAQKALDVKNVDSDKKKENVSLEFVKYLFNNNRPIVVKIDKLIDLVANNGSKEELGKLFYDTIVELSVEFMNWGKTAAGKKIIEAFITDAGKNGVNVAGVEEVFTIIKNKDITLDNLFKVAGTAFPYLKFIQKGIKFAATTTDFVTFFFNMNSPVLDQIMVLPVTNNLIPTNKGTLNKNTGILIVEFQQAMTVPSNLDKEILIRDSETHQIIQKYTPNDLFLIDNNQKVTLALKNIEQLLDNKEYYVVFPNGIIFNNDGSKTWQGTFAQEDWSFTTQTPEPVVTAVSPLEATIGTETTFTITGTNLTEGMGFWIANLENPTEVTGGNATTRYFKGTPSGTVGAKEGIVKDAPGGNTLFPFEVEFTQSTIYEGNVTLTTQQEVEDFGAKRYSEIHGFLQIGVNNIENDISNLSALSDLINITNRLYVYNCNNLTNLNGLNNLLSALGIWMSNNDVLSDISQLFNINVSGILLITDNSNLISLKGLSNISSLIEVNISNNINLTDINDLQNLTTIIGGNLTISANSSLSSIDGLSNLTQLSGNISIGGNALTDLDAFANLTNIGGSLGLNEDNLTNINGFSNIQTIGGSIGLGSRYSNYNNQNLENVSFPNLISCGGIGMSRMNSVTTISFPNLETLGSLIIYSNHEITSMNFNRLKTITGDVWISNSGLTLESFGNLTKIEGDVWLGEKSNYPYNAHSALNTFNTLEGLNNLTTINGDFRIGKNKNLTNLCAIETLAKNGGNLGIYENAYNPTTQDIIDGNCSQ